MRLQICTFNSCSNQLWMARAEEGVENYDGFTPLRTAIRLMFSKTRKSQQSIFCNYVLDNFFGIVVHNNFLFRTTLLHIAIGKLLANCRCSSCGMFLRTLIMQISADQSYDIVCLWLKVSPCTVDNMHSFR